MVETRRKLRIAYLAARQSSWRRHPLRRLNVKRQEVQIALGDWLLKAFPFLRGPAEWLESRIGRWVR